MSTLADNMVGNTALNAASKAKDDEFYTCLEDIDAELDHYKDHFRGKVVLCNCDDPYESNFFKHFALNFNRLGLKKLITTCYVGSPVSHTAVCLDHWLDGESDDGTPDNEKEPRTGRKKVPYKIEITEVKDYNGDGAVDISDVEYLLENDANTSTVLSGNGDFRSPECIEALKEADIVVTNPPFSLFREYVALLMKHDKKFLIIGNQNAISYKEFFPYLRDNKVWLGATIHNGDREFRVPNYYNKSSNYRIDDNGYKYVRVRGPRWYTNLDYTKRHEPIRLYARYDPEKYPKYDNYSAIEVSKVCDIPEDYMESMGVPSEYADRFDADSFETVRREAIGGRDYVFIREKDGAHGGKDSMALICKGLGVPEEEMEWCNGSMGVPITFLDKYSPEQFEILGLDRYIEDNPTPGRRFLLRGRETYARVIIRCH